MENFNLFLNKIKRLEINVVEYRYSEGVGWKSVNEYPNLPNNLKKSYWWELPLLNENELKELQSNAVNEVMLLTTELLQNCLKRLEEINYFSVFYDFIKKFYVKFLENKYDGRDVTDFKLELEGCFTVNVPEKGNFDIHFLGELQDQIFYKHALLDGLKYQIEKLLPEQPQQTTNQDDPNPISHVFANGGFYLFEVIRQNFINDLKGRIADFSFFYHRLKNEKYIHIKQTPFLEWYTSQYEHITDKIRPEAEVYSLQRENNYKTAKELVRTKK